MNTNDQQPQYEINTSKAGYKAGILPILMFSALAFGVKAAEGSTAIEPGAVVSLDDRSGPSIRALIEQPVNGFPVPKGLQCDDPGLRARNASDLARVTRSTLDEAVGIVIGGGKGKIIDKAVKIAAGKEVVSRLFGSNSNVEIAGPIDSEALALYCALEHERRYGIPTPTGREKIRALERQFNERQAKVNGAWEDKRSEMMESLEVGDPLEVAMAQGRTQEFQLLKLGKIWQEAAQTNEDIDKIDVRLTELGEELDAISKELLAQTSEQIKNLETAFGTLSNAVETGTLTRRELLMLTRPDLAAEFGGLNSDELVEALNKRITEENEVRKAMQQIEEFDAWSQAAGSVVSLFDPKAGKVVSSLGSALTSLGSLGVAPSPIMIANAVSSVSNFIGALLFGGRDVGAERHAEVMNGLNAINDNVNRVYEQVERLEDLVLKGNESLHDRLDGVDDRLANIGELIADSRRIGFDILRSVGVTNDRVRSLSQTFYDHDDASEVHASQEARRDREDARREFEIAQTIFSTRREVLTPENINYIVRNSLALATVISGESAFTGSGTIKDILSRTTDGDQRVNLAARQLMMGESRYQREFLRDAVSRLLRPVNEIDGSSEREFTEGVELLLELAKVVGAERLGMDPMQYEDLIQTGERIQGASQVFVHPDLLQTVIDAYTMEAARLEEIVGGYLISPKHKDTAGALPQWDLTRGIEQFQIAPEEGTMSVGIKGISEAGRDFLKSGSLDGFLTIITSKRVHDVADPRLKKVVKDVEDKGLDFDPNLFGINEHARVALGFRGDSARAAHLANLLCNVEGAFSLRPYYPSEADGTVKIEKETIDEGQWIDGERGKEQIPYRYWKKNLVEYVTKSFDYRVYCSPTFTFALTQDQGKSPLAFLQVEVLGRDEIVRDRFYQKTRNGKVIKDGPTLVQGPLDPLDQKYTKMWNEGIKVEIANIVATTISRVMADKKEHEILMEVKYRRNQDRAGAIILATVSNGNETRTISYNVSPNYRPTVPKGGAVSDRIANRRPTVPAHADEEPFIQDQGEDLSFQTSCSYNFTLRWNDKFLVIPSVDAFSAAEQRMTSLIAEDAVTPGTEMYQSLIRLDAYRQLLGSLLQEGGNALPGNNQTFRNLRDHVASLPGRHTVEGELVSGLLSTVPARILADNIQNRVQCDTADLSPIFEDWREEYPKLRTGAFGSHELRQSLTELRDLTSL